MSERQETQIVVRMPAEMAQAVRELAEAEERSVAQIVRFAIRDYLNAE